jgi:hypothetical protein
MQRTIALSAFFLLFLFSKSRAQTDSLRTAKDSVFLMNGHVIGEKVMDTLLGAVSIQDPEKPGKLLHYELAQLYMVKYTSGIIRYYYRQDSAQYNYFTRDEMWMFMKGEVDARKGFKPKGSIIGAGIAGLIGGMSGTFYAPVLPYGYMALSGITKVRIRGKTISNPVYVDSDGYILGYERVARHKRKIQSIVSGSIGLAVGYLIYGLTHQYYPETIDIGVGK